MNDPLRLLVINLDMALTGKERRHCEHTMRNSSIKDENGWLFGSKRAYYLSDGGYSRVCADIQDRADGGYRPALFLANVSRDEVFERWNTPEAQRLVAAIKAHLQAYIDKLES